MKKLTNLSSLLFAALICSTSMFGQNVGIGTTTPQAKLHLKSGSLLVDGAIGTTPASGIGERFMWIPARKSIRAGHVSTTQWDDANIGSYSAAFGKNTTASGLYSFSMGYSSTASGLSASALGNNCVAAGAVSTSIGYFVDAPSYGETAIGVYNNPYTAASSSTFNGDDRVFSIGNGVNYNTRSNAMVVLKNGRVGIGADEPDALLEVEDGAVLFEGVTGNTPISGEGSRFMWIPSKKAVRAGGVSSTQWDDVNIGNYSTAMGYNVTASNDYAVSMGSGTIASGIYSVALGTYTDATGDFSTALGYESTASGATSFTWGRFSSASGATSMALGSSAWAQANYANAIGIGTRAEATYSIAMGYYTNASGTGAMSIGSNTTARTFRETVLGSYNSETTSNLSATTWNLADPILIVGNGMSSTSKSDAMVILKNGNVGIGDSSPDEKLHIDGKLKFGSYETLEDGGSSRIGANCALIPMTDNLFDLGTSTNRWDDIYATNGTVQTSDRRNKTNVQSLQYGLKEIMQLKPVSFQWIDKPYQGQKLGLIAQDLQQVVKEVVKEKDWIQNEQGELEEVELERLGVYYSDLVPVLIKAIQQQQATIESQQAQIKDQQSDFNLLRSEIEDLKKMIE